MKIKPRIRGPKNYEDFTDLKSGDAFIYHGDLYIKVDDTDNNYYSQIAVCLSNGELFWGLDGESVLPVTAETTWTR